MFPRLYEEGSKDRSIPASTLAKIYDEGIRPAVSAVCPTRLSHWPPSYSAASNNARDTRGKLHFGTVDIPAHSIAEFGEELRRRLARVPELADMYFMHEVRGTKGSTVHDPRNIAQRWETLQKELGFLDFDNMTASDWYIDVGFELYLPNHVLQWLGDAHLRLLQFGLPEQAQTDPASLERLVDDRKNFAVDRVAQLKEFAGFRCMPRTRGQSDHIAYLNVYTTDKEPTYQLHTGSFRRHMPSELLAQSSTQKLIADVTSMTSIYGQCMGDGERAPNEGCARFEVRVELDLAPSALDSFPNELISSSVVAVPVKLWWLVTLCPTTL